MSAFDAREWADLHGEPYMTRRQFDDEIERDEAEKRLADSLQAEGEGYCCVMAAMHMGHDEDCRGYVCSECSGRGWTEYESGVVAPDGVHEWLKEPCGTCNADGLSSPAPAPLKQPGLSLKGTASKLGGRAVSDV